MGRTCCTAVGSIVRATIQENAIGIRGHTRNIKDYTSGRLRVKAEAGRIPPNQIHHGELWKRRQRRGWRDICLALWSL